MRKKGLLTDRSTGLMVTHRILLLIIATSLLLCGFGSCSRQLSDFCREPNDPQYESRYLALRTPKPEARNPGIFAYRSRTGSPSRSLASLSDQDAASIAGVTESLQSMPPARLVSAIGRVTQRNPSTVSATDQEFWRDWSTSKLQEVESLLDLTYAESSLLEIHEELGHIANDLVLLYGYSNLGRADRMVQILIEIDARKQKIRALACH